MAKAKKKTIEVPVTMIKVEKDGVILELTRDETEFLASVLSKIGGDPDNTCREHSNSIKEALEGQEYFYTNSRFYSKIEGHLQCMR